MGKHYKYGGSTIERAAMCPASAHKCHEMGDVWVGDAADRGTQIHQAVHEIWTSQPRTEIAADREAIAQAVVQSLFTIAHERGLAPGEIYLEYQMAMHETHPDAGGTPDGFAVRQGGDIIMIDFKMGYQKVEAERNVQEMFYTCTLVQNLDPVTRASIQNGTVYLYIVQPPLEAGAPVNVRMWSMPVSELPAWQGYFNQAIAIAEANPNQFNPGDWCESKFCHYAPQCAHYDDWLNRLSGGMLARLKNEPQHQEVPKGVALAQWLEAAPRINKLLETAKIQAKQLMDESPDAIPNFHPEDQMSDRFWSDLKLVDAFCKEHGLKPSEFKPPVYLTPKQLEDLLKKRSIAASIDDLTTQTRTGIRITKGAYVNPLQAIIA